MTPKYKITADSKDITNLLTGRLLSLSIIDEIGLVSDTLTLELDDRDSVLEIPPRGAEIGVLLGYDELYPMGRFIADECEIKSPPATMTITARASNSAFRDMGAFKSPRTQSWEKQTIADIVQTIAGRYGLTTGGVAPEYQTIMVSHLDQTDESDCAFIQRVAADYGASVKVANGQLFFIEPFSGRFPDGSPMPAIVIRESEISSFQMRLAERAKYGAVVAKYYDFDAAEEKQVSAGNESPIFTLRDTYTNATQAQARAAAKLAEIQSGTRTLSLDLIGNPMICAESVIEIPNLRPEIAGRWIVKSARHTLSAGGYKTAVEAVKAKRE